VDFKGWGLGFQHFNIFQKIKIFISKKIIKKYWLKISLNTYYTEKTFKKLFSI